MEKVLSGKIDTSVIASECNERGNLIGIASVIPRNDRKRLLNNPCKWSLFILLLLLFLVTNVSAATKTWDGVVDGGLDTGSNNWTTATNWVGDIAPALNDDVIFDATSTKACIIDAAPPTLTSITVNTGYTSTSITQIASVTVTNLSINTSITWSIQSGSALAVSGNIANSGTIIADSGTATLSGTATKTVGGSGSTTFYNLAISNGAGDASYQLTGNITVSNILTIAATDSLDLSTKNLSLGGSLANSGTLTATGGTTTMTGTNKTFGGAGTTTVYNLTINGSNSALAGNITVSGDLTVNSGKSLDLVTYNLNLAGSLANSGTITVTSGTTTLTGTGKTFGGTGTTTVSDLTITGSYQISGSITVKGDLTGAGTITGATSSTVTLTKAAAGALSATSKTFYNLIIDGAYTLTGNMEVTNVLTVNLTKSLTLGANTVTLSGAGTPLVANGTLTTTNSTVTYTSSTGATVGTVNITYNNLTINSAGQIFLLAGNLTVSNDLTVTSGTLNAETKNLAISGNIAVTSPGTLTASGPSATTVDGAAKTLGGSGTTTFYNLTISNGAGNATYTLNGNITVSGDLTITATDSLDLSTKNLSLAGILANTGTLTASAASTTTLSGTTKTFGGAGATTVYNLTVSGTYTLSGNITVNNDLTIDSAKSLDLSTNNLPLAGTLNNSGTLTASAASTTTLSGATKTFGGSGSTTFYNLAVTGSYEVNGSVRISNDLTGAGTITPATNSTVTLGTVGSALSITTKTFYNLTIDGAYTLTGNMEVTNILTINTGKSLALGANTLTLSASTDVIQGTGTLTINTSKIKYTNATGTTLENLSYYNLETVLGTFSASTNLIVTNDLTITSGTLALGSNNLTLSGTLLNSGTLSASSGSTATLDGTGKNMGGGGPTTFYTLVIAGTYTATGNFTVNNTVTINLTKSLDLSTYTMTLTASGTPFVATGTFTQNASTVLYTSTSGATVATTNITYYNLTINSSGQTFTPDGNLVCTGDLTISSGTLSLGTRNLNVTGHISNSGSLLATAPSATTVSGAAKQIGGSGTTNLYTVVVDGTYTATGDITVASTITINATKNLNLSNKTLTLTASGTPLVASDATAFTASTSTVKYTSSSGATVGTTNITYYKLEISSSGQTFSVGAALTCNNDLTVTAGTLSTASNMSIGGSVSNSDILTATAGTATLSGASKTVGGTGTTTLNNVTVSGSYQINNTITVAGDLAGAGIITTSMATSSTVTLTKAAAGALSTTTKTFHNLTIDGVYTLTGDMTVSNVLTINNGKSLDIQTNTLTLTGAGTPLVINGTGALNTTGATSTVAYITTATANVTGLSTYDNLTINGTGVFTATGTIICGANLTVSAGTFSLSANDLTITGNISVALAGTLTATGGTTTVNGVAGTEILGGAGTTTFYNLTVSNAGNSTYTLAGIVTVNGVLTIAASDTLNLSDKRLNFGGSGDVLQGTGTLTIGTSTIGYTGSSGCTIENLAYNNLTIAGAGTFLPSANLAVAKDLTISSGTLNLSTYNLSVAESLLNTGGVVTATNSSTTTLTGTGENLGGSGSTTFYNLVIGDGAGDSYTLTGDVTTLNNITVIAGAQLDLVDKNISVNGNLSNLGTIVSSGTVGTLTLSGTSAGLTAPGAGVTTVDNLVVAGTYTLDNNITIDQNLTNNSGSAFNHNSKNVTVGGTTSSSNHFEIITLHNQKEVENISFSVTVILKNQNNATVTGYNGAHNVTWTSTATASVTAVVPTIHPNGVITFINGAATVGGFILTDVDEQPTISLTDDNNTTGTSAKIRVLAGKFVDNNVGATIERPDKTKVVIPAGALKSPNSLIVINIPDSTSLPSFGKGYSKRILDTGISREMGYFEGHNIKDIYFNSNVTITIPYATSAIGYTPEEKLKIYYYDVPTTMWKEIDGTHTVNTSTKTITVDVTHFSLFTIMGTWVANDLAGVKVYPNPCTMAGAFENKIKFVNLTKDATIKIYTVEGELVRALSEIDFGNDGWITWDGQNENREDVARGIYLYIATNESGGKATGKIAIIR